MFKCAHCVFETPNVEHLTDHVKKSHASNKPKSHKCKFCAFTTDKYTSLLQHREAKHKNEAGKASESKGASKDSSSHSGGRRILVCKYCSIFQTCDNDELVMHFKLKHSNEKNKTVPVPTSPVVLPCSKCSDSGYKGLLASTNCCSKILFECILCKSAVTSREKLLEHLTNQHSSAVRCSRCPLSFHSAKALVDHAAAKHGTLKTSLFHCPLCHQLNEHHERILQHTLDKHCSKKLGYVCGLCDFYNTNFADVTSHIKLHHSQDITLCKHSVSTVEIPSKAPSTSVPKGLLCSMCDKVLPTTTSLEEHFLNTHFTNKDSKVLCFICGEPAHNYCLLKIHTKEAHNVDKVICECFFCNPIPGSKKICYISKDTPDLLSHFKDEHDLSLTCSICKVSTGKNLPSAIAALDLKPEDFEPASNKNNCFACKFSGKSLDSLVQHYVEAHAKREVLQQCIFPNCGATFNNLNSALMHVIVEQHGRDSSALKATDAAFSCNIVNCSFSIPDKMQFRDHLLKAHVKILTCTACAIGKKCGRHP